MQTVDSSADFSLFVLNAEQDKPGATVCAGILCPTKPEQWPVATLSSHVHAWQENQPEEKLTWRLHPTLVLPFGEDTDSRVRSSACSVHVFIVRGKLTKTGKPFFLSPSPGICSVVFKVELKLCVPSLFYLAGYQSYIWMGMVGAVIYEGVWDPPGTSELGAARNVRFRPGDALPFITQGSETFAGVALLQQQLKDDVFLSSLHFNTPSVSISNNDTLVSVETSRLDCITNRFEVPFARIMAIW